MVSLLKTITIPRACGFIAPECAAPECAARVTRVVKLCGSLSKYLFTAQHWSPTGYIPTLLLASFNMISRTALLRPFSSPFGLFAAFASTCSLSRDGKKLNLQCDGEAERRYHGVWLRHNCTCPICLSSSTKQTIVHHSSLIELTIKDATLKGIYNSDKL